MSEHVHKHGEGCDIEHFNTTDLIVREDILNKAKELAALISTADEIQVYQKAEVLINENDEVQRLIKLIKKKQKEIVAFESFQNSKMVEKIDGEIKELQEKLEQIPIVNQFQQSQSDINYLLQLIISVIKDTVSDKISVEAGTSVAPTTCSD